MLDQVRLSVHASQPDAAFVAGQVAVFMAKRVSSWIKYGSESGLFDASSGVLPRFIRLRMTPSEL